MELKKLLRGWADALPATYELVTQVSLDILEERLRAYYDTQTEAGTGEAGCQTSHGKSGRSS